MKRASAAVLMVIIAICGGLVLCRLGIIHIPGLGLAKTNAVSPQVPAAVEDKQAKMLLTVLPVDPRRLCRSRLLLSGGAEVHAACREGRILPASGCEQIVSGDAGQELSAISQAGAGKEA